MSKRNFFTVVGITLSFVIAIGGWFLTSTLIEIKSEKLQKTPKPEIDRRVRETAKMLGIDALLNRKPKQLSGGERQRAAMGRAIVREPQVFLMDEPLSNLDMKLRTQMRAEIARLHQKLETTFIYVTHDQTEAMTLGNRVIVMKDGVIQQADTPHNLFNNPVNTFVAGFIGTPQMNFFDVTVDRVGLRMSEYNFPLEPERLAMIRGQNNLIIGLRPKDIHVMPNETESITAKVELVEQLGSETYLHLKILDETCIASVQPESQTKIGDIIKVKFNMAKAYLFEPSGTKI